MSISNPSITLAKGAASATLIGVIAVFLWACLALLTTLTAGIPAFQLLASSFAVAFVASLCMLGLRGAAGFSSWRQPWSVWATGFAGIFVYHALYFFALKAAPAAEASLIAYLWPLLIVLLSSFATGESLRKRQLLGALLGLAGTAFIMQLRARNDIASMPVIGYAAALPAPGSGRSIRCSTGVSAMFRAASSGVFAGWWQWPEGSATWLSKPRCGLTRASGRQSLPWGWARSAWLFSPGTTRPSTETYRCLAPCLTWRRCSPRCC